jgi:HAMP domain-containing protein
MDEKRALNIQAAKTAVVRLASDISTVCSTVNAADFDAEVNLQAKELFDTAFNAASSAKTALAPNLREVELAASAVNRLANLIIRQKALNPRISNDLISRVSQAVKDAEEAVSLTATAQK